DEQPYTVSAYLEKAGYGSQAAAPVVKCTFIMLSGLIEADPVVISEPLDLSATTSAPAQKLADVGCFARRGGG
ncbi:MAG: hypothetical protein ACPHO9_03590, partial [Ilumatobacteraceae bacterium]